MLTLVTLFLGTLLTALISVRIYRAISRRWGFRQTVVGHKKKTVRMTLRAQMGYIELVPSSQQREKSISLHHPKGDIKAPWGW